MLHRMEGIYLLPVIKDYWSAEEGLCNPLIQKGITRARFWEKLQNMHFADNFQNLSPRDQEIVTNKIVLGNCKLCLNNYWSIFKETMEPESHHSIEKHMCKFKRKSLCVSTWKTSQSSWVLNFGFVADQSRDIYTSLTCTWERKGTLSSNLVN